MLKKTNNNNNNNNNKKIIIKIIIKIKKVPSSLPKKKKYSYNTPDGGPHGNSQGIGAVIFCRKDLHHRGCSYPRFYSFLCKCNLTKVRLLQLVY